MKLLHPLLWIFFFFGEALSSELDDNSPPPSWMVSVDPKKMTPSQRDDILLEERRQRKRLKKISKLVEAGEETNLEKVPALHDLGRLLYKLEKFDGAIDIANQVAAIYAEHYGNVDRRTVAAYMNVASTLHRLGRTEECHVLMKRLFPLQLDRFGEGSKEVAYHIGKMNIFKVPDEEVAQMLNEWRLRKKGNKKASETVHPDGL